MDPSTVTLKKKVPQGGWGGGLHIKFARRCVLRIEKYTHFEGLLMNLNITIKKGLFIKDAPY